MYFSAPGNNACGGQGGCAVPISESQLFPEPKEGVYKTTFIPLANMAIHDFYYKGSDKDEPASKPIHIDNDDDCRPKYYPYQEGDNVYDVAWTAYMDVLGKRGIKKDDLPVKPEPSPFRLAFPPST